MRRPLQQVYIAFIVCESVCRIQWVVSSNRQSGQEFDKSDIFTQQIRTTRVLFGDGCFLLSVFETNLVIGGSCPYESRKKKYRIQVRYRMQNCIISLICVVSCCHVCVWGLILGLQYISDGPDYATEAASKTSTYIYTYPGGI